LERIATFFELNRQEKLALMDAAALQRMEIPADLADSELLQKALPAFFRAARGHELDERELEQLAQDVLALHKPNPKHS